MGGEKPINSGPSEGIIRSRYKMVVLFQYDICEHNGSIIWFYSDFKSVVSDCFFSIRMCLRCTDCIDT